MAAQDKTVITPVIAARNALPYFEIVIQGWGSGPDDEIGRFYRLPKIPLTGIAISPESTVDQVYVQEDFRAYTGSLQNYNDITFGAIMESIGSADDPVPPELSGFASGDTHGGSVAAHRSQVSVHAPLIKSIGSSVAIVARNQSRYNAHYFSENGEDRQIPVLRTREPVLVLRCYIRAPGPFSYPSSRVPILSNLRGAPVHLDRGGNPVQTGLGPDFVVQAIPIGGRRRFHLELWALPDGATGTDTGTIKVRASVLRGGEAKRAGNLNPAQSGNFFEQEIIPVTQLTPGGHLPNKVRFDELNNSAEWLLLSVEQTTLDLNVCEYSYVVRAED